MPQPATALTDRTAWKDIATHASEMKNSTIKDLFAKDPGRGPKFTLEAEELLLDYSKNRITEETVKLLTALAGEVDLKGRTEAMFTGEKINVTENRAVLHVALRAPKDEVIKVDGEDVVPEVHQVLDKMSGFAEKVRSGEWKGYTGKRIRAGHGVRGAEALR